MVKAAALLLLGGVLLLASALRLRRRRRTLALLRSRLGLARTRPRPRTPSPWPKRILGAALLGSALSLGGGVLFGGMGFGLLLLALFLYDQRQLARAREAEEEAWPDVLHELAAGLEAGLSAFSVLEAVARRTPPPLGPLLTRFARDVALGAPVAEATALLEREGRTATAKLFAGSLRLHSEAGGALGPSLRTLENAARARLRLKRKVHALTAQGRFSAAILFALPWAVMAVMEAANPHYLVPLLTTPLGRLAVGVTLLLMGVGAIWIRSLIRWEV